MTFDLIQKFESWQNLQKQNVIGSFPVLSQGIARLPVSGVKRLLLTLFPYYFPAARSYSQQKLLPGLCAILNCCGRLRRPKLDGHFQGSQLSGGEEASPRSLSRAAV